MPTNRLISNSRGPQPKQNGRAVSPSRKPRNKRPKTKPITFTGDPSDPPEWLSGVGSAKWRELAPHLIEHGLLTSGDRDLFGCYCAAFADAQAARALIDRDGQFVTSKTGVVTLHPAWKVVKSATDVMIKLQSLYGLTPAARARLKVVVADDDIDPTISEIFGD